MKLPAGAVATSIQKYGAQLQLDMFDVPDCFGHNGVGQQYLVVCPKRRLVLVWFSSQFDFSRPKVIHAGPTLRRLVLAFPEETAE